MRWMAQRRALAKEGRAMMMCTKGEVQEGASEGKVGGGEERAEAMESQEEAGEAEAEEEGSESGSKVGGEALEGVARWGGEEGDEAEAGVGIGEVESKSLQALTLTFSPSPPLPPGSNLHHHYQLLSDKSPTGNMKLEEVGVALINLLLKCATHVSAGDLAGTDTCLHLISALASPSCDPLQLHSSHLASALIALLLHHRLPGLLSALHHPRPLLPTADLTFVGALLHLPFVHAITARILLHSFANARRCAVHLVDLHATTSFVGLWVPLLGSSLAHLYLLGGSPP